MCVCVYEIPKTGDIIRVGYNSVSVFDIVHFAYFLGVSNRHLVSQNELKTATKKVIIRDSSV